jgi:ubiquinone/menaquinone biosynthesis C-methylase UbiE
LVTCKLAFHYFPHPQMALQEMRRITTRTGRVVPIDRVSAEDETKRVYQNQVEALRTPANTCVYSASQLVAALETAGFVVDERADDAEHTEA